MIKILQGSHLVFFHGSRAGINAQGSCDPFKNTNCSPYNIIRFLGGVVTAQTIDIGK